MQPQADACIRCLLHPLPAAEARAGQGQRRREIIGQQLTHGHAGPAARPVEQRVASREQAGVELGEVRVLGRRDHQVAPDEPDGVLDGALPVVRMGVAEAHLEAVVPAERQEQRALAHRPCEPPAASVALSRTTTGGTSPMCSKTCSIDAHGTRIPGPSNTPLSGRWSVGGEHELVHAHLDAPEDGPGAAVVALRRARGPLELEEPLLARGWPRVAPAAHEALDRGERVAVPALGYEAAVGPPCGVVLLSRHEEVGLEPGGDHVGVEGPMVGLVRAGLTGGRGERPSDTYLETVFPLTRSASAISLCDLPRMWSPLTHSRVDLGIVILPSSSSRVWGNLWRGL